MPVPASQLDIIPASGSQPEEGARPRTQVIALSRDPELLEVLQDVVLNESLVFLSNEAELAGRLLNGRAGVVVLDTETVGSGMAELARSLHAQLPDLALIAAGTTQDEPELAPLLTAGIIHRFLHKPVSAQRVKLFIDAAWRRHESSVSGTWPMLPQIPDPTGLPSVVLPGAAAGLVAMVAGVVWFSVRLGDHRPEASAPRAPAPQVERGVPRAAPAVSVPVEQPARLHFAPRPTPLPRVQLQALTTPTQPLTQIPADIAAALAAVAAPAPVALPAPAASAPAASAPAAAAAPAAVTAAGPAAPAQPAAADDPQQHKVISALLLQKTHFVNPEYPLAAREHDASGGSVDLEFTVRADGSVADIVVTHAEPLGVYEACAVKAVGQWRYEPIVRGGHPVDQRVRLQLRFAYRDPTGHP